MNVFDLPSHLVSCLLREWLDALSIGRIDSSICSKSIRPTWLYHLQKDGKFCKNITRPRNDDSQDEELHHTLVPWLIKREIMPSHLIIVHNYRVSSDIYRWIQYYHEYKDCDSIVIRDVVTPVVMDNNGEFHSSCEHHTLMIMKRFINKIHTLHINILSKQMLQQFIESQNNVRILDHFGPFFCYDLDLTIYFPNLERLYLNLDEDDLYDSSEESTSDVIHFIHNKLKVLQVGDFEWNLRSQKLLKRFPNLVSFISLYWSGTSHEIREILDICPKMTSFHIFDIQLLLDEFYEGVKMCYPQITQLLCSCSCTQMNNHIFAIQKIFPNLITMKVMNETSLFMKEK